MSLADIVSKAAPILGGFLTAGPVGAGAVALKMLASEFGVEPTEDAVSKAISADPDAAVKLAQIEADNKVALQRLLIENKTAQLVAVNGTMQVEAKADDAYVRRWRPTIGYVVAFQFALVGLAVFIGVLGAVFYAKDAAQSTAIMQGLAALVGSMTVIIATECAVLGVNIHKRSQDKTVAAGITPAPGLLSGLFGAKT